VTTDDGKVAATAQTDGALLEVRDLFMHFPIKSGILIDREIGRVRAVDGVDLTVKEGETLGLVGESGCGKSTLCRAILQLLKPTSGSVRFEGREIVGLKSRAMQPVRREMQMIFQDPYASLNPRHRVGQIVGDPIRLTALPREELKRNVNELLERVGLAPSTTTATHTSSRADSARGSGSRERWRYGRG
jgi:oligopeptide transport system ATP-binding protein